MNIEQNTALYSLVLHGTRYKLEHLSFLLFLRLFLLSIISEVISGSFSVL